MPELDIMYSRVCASCEGWETTIEGSKGDKYKVVWGPDYTGRYAYGWTCTCPGFKFRRECKHIERAKREVCHWGVGAYSGSPSEANKDGSCPNCGGPTLVVKVGV